MLLIIVRNIAHMEMYKVIAEVSLKDLSRTLITDSSNSSFAPSK